MGYKLVSTKDNSNTFFSTKYNQSYHCISDGAINESLYKYTIPTIKYCKKKNIKILDICFGLGYNIFSTIDYIKRHNLDLQITFFSPELDKELINRLIFFKYPKQFDNIKNIIDKVLTNKYYKDEQFEIYLKITDARDYIKSLSDIDIVFQDPFSLDVNKELWDYEYFTNISKILNKSGLIFTYSIASNVRYTLYKLGFNVYEEKSLTKKFSIFTKLELPIKKIDMQKKLSNNPNLKVVM